MSAGESMPRSCPDRSQIGALKSTKFTKIVLEKKLIQLLMEEPKMTFTVEQLQDIYENQLFINFSESQRETIWKQTQKLPHSCAGGRWRAFLNSLCLSLITDWLQSDLEFSEMD